MKLILLRFFAFCFIGFVCEWTYRIIKNEPVPGDTRLDKLKLLLMMPVYGGACVVIGLFYQIPAMQNITLLPVMCLIGMIIADLFELGYGMLFNKVLNIKIWDYSDSKIKIFGKVIPANLFGQIDLYHSILWFVLTIPTIYFDSIIRWLAK